MSFLELQSDTDPASIEPALASGSIDRIQFYPPLPDAVLVATAEALRLHPAVVLRVYGREIDPNLSWLSGFEHVRHLSVDLWEARSFDLLADFNNLRSLGLGQTASRRPSLDFVRQLSLLESLFIEGHDKDFEAVGEVGKLRHLSLRVSRAKSLDALQGHGSLEVFAMDFGSIRDLSPLGTIPQLRGLELYQVRKLDGNDLNPLGECPSLEAVSLGALPNVSDLTALSCGLGETLRFLILERLTGLSTLADVAQCDQLEQLALFESRPADKRLDVLLDLSNLRHLMVGDVYPRRQVTSLLDGFNGETLWYRGNYLRGSDSIEVKVGWRQPVDQLLD